VILASALILYALIYGMDAARKAVPPWAARVTLALGAFIFAAVGFVSLFFGENYLDYDVLHPTSKTRAASIWASCWWRSAC
jgi:multicomponent Na+:H+ antiporter subunit B